MNTQTPKPMSKWVLSDTAYNFTKKVVQLGFPASASLYFGLSKTWGLPASEQVVGTLALMATFLGVILSMSSRAYNASDAKYDGDVVVQIGQNGSKKFSLDLNGDPDELDQKKEVKFKVNPTPMVADEDSTPTS